MKQIRFRMTAFSDAAGKYNPDATRDGNEDNWYVDDDLGDETPGSCAHDKEVVLSDCGMLMVVADGMGGMNAGEVASEIAVKTVEECFAPGRITPQLAATRVSRQKYMEEVITEADARIKKDAAHNPEHEGMGSTIIMAWLAGDELTVSWCGDSRAYRFNPRSGIEMLSEDHSYVQDLVKAGSLSYEDTFGHPHGNIITRSLGDPVKKAQPESRHFKVYRSDIILLCSDGLSGVLFDREARRETGELISPENIEDIIRANCSTMKGCREALMQAAERNDWYDNVTVILCEILDGADEIPEENAQLPQTKVAGEFPQPTLPVPASPVKSCHKGFWVGMAVVLLLLCFAGGVWCGQCEAVRGVFNVPLADSVAIQRKAKLIELIRAELQESVQELGPVFKELNDSISGWNDSVWNKRYDLFFAKYSVLRLISSSMLTSSEEIKAFYKKVREASEADSCWKDEIERLIKEYEQNGGVERNRNQKTTQKNGNTSASPTEDVEGKGALSEASHHQP